MEYLTIPQPDETYIASGSYSVSDNSFESVAWSIHTSQSLKRIRVHEIVSSANGQHNFVYVSMVDTTINFIELLMFNPPPEKPLFVRAYYVIAGDLCIVKRHVAGREPEEFRSKLPPMSLVSVPLAMFTPHTVFAELNYPPDSLYQSFSVLMSSLQGAFLITLHKLTIQFEVIETIRIDGQDIETHRYATVNEGASVKYRYWIDKLGILVKRHSLPDNKVVVLKSYRYDREVKVF
jgi:hypothetical protein